MRVESQEQLLMQTYLELSLGGSLLRARVNQYVHTMNERKK
jgi:hypothetical protein